MLAGTHFVQGDDAIGLGVGKAAQEYGIDHGEDGAIRADAEREHGDGGRGEGRVLGQHAGTESKVAKHGFEQVAGAHVADPLLDLFDAVALA